MANINKLKDNKKLKKLYEEDINEKTNADWSDKEAVAQIDRNDKKRKEIVERIIARGGLKTAKDYHWAALIFQHGNSTSDYLKANKLAKKAIEMGDKNAGWLYAATMDRWLISQGKPQKYGTQFRKNKKGEWELGRIDKRTTNKERVKLNIPPLSEALLRFKEKYKKLD